MNQKEQFIASLEKKEVDYVDIFAKLYKKVIATNAMTGLVRDNLTESELKDKIEVYKKFTEDEKDEMIGAYEEHDKYEFIKESIDILVVAGYQYYLVNGYSPEIKTHAKVGVDSAVEILKEANSLYMILHYTESLLTMTGCDLQQAVDAVLNENISKFPTLQDISNAYAYAHEGEEVGTPTEVLLKWACSQLEGERYSGVTAEMVADSEGTERYVMWCAKEYNVEKRKYLKGLSFKRGCLKGIWK